ncbi:MAG: DUF4838 domain-containing protein [Clostridia bacterium]|nr:DUF4838 domain-containing protein [Clostridia bacterium]
MEKFKKILSTAVDKIKGLLGYKFALPILCAVLALAVVGTVAIVIATNGSNNQEEVTTPVEVTTPAVTTPEVTTPEIIIPEETTPEDTRVAYTVTVVDENNAPLSGATVQMCVGDLCRLPALTGADGVASFLFDPDNYTVKVTIKGYIYEASYTFAEGSTELTVQLTKIPEETTPEETTPEETTPEETTPEEVLPEAPEMKLTTVKVTTGKNASEVLAGTELVKYLNKKGITVADDGFPIHISINPSLKEGSYTVESSLGADAGMTIQGGVERDVLFGVYKFLEEYAGFRYFTYNLEIYTEDDVVITDGVLMNYTPVIGPRRLTWYSVYHDGYYWCLKNGVNFGVSLSEEQGGQSLNYGGDWFVHTIGKLTETTYPYPDYCSNPCLTDPEIYATVLKNVRAELTKNPNINIFSISQTDVEVWCKCPNCSKIEEEEGSYSGVWVRFLNKIAEELEDEFPNVTFDTLAYKHTQKAPKITKPRENVCIRLCSITCCFTHAIDDPNCTRNQEFCQDIIAWGKICENIHIWDYTTDFHYYISTFANLFTIYDNMQFFAKNNAVSMFPQGNGQGISGEFGELRAYLLAKLMCDPYMSREEYSNHMNEFLAAYYGEGWEYIRAFIDKTSELAANGGYKLDSNEAETTPVCGQGIYDHPLTVITRQEYLDNETYFDELWANALAAAGDREEYVARSMMQWRLTKLYLHPNAEEAQKLIDDAKAAGVVWKEGNPNVQTDSDLSLSPYYWKYGK